MSHSFDEKRLDDLFMIMKQSEDREADESFVRESKLIEGISREPTLAEINEHRRFLSLDVVSIGEVIRFVGIYEPGAVIRDKDTLNVIVGNHKPPIGGVSVVNELKHMLENIGTTDPYSFHCAYESLHPFMDCNGRSGRVIWAWQMFKKTGQRPDRFLQTFYYQSLSAGGS
jgi:hypothetical protein